MTRRMLFFTYVHAERAREPAYDASYRGVFIPNGLAVDHRYRPSYVGSQI